MTTRNLKWLENGPRRFDIDSPLLVVGVFELGRYPELFEDHIMFTTGNALPEGQYLAADEETLEEPEVGVIFRSCIPEIANTLLEDSGKVKEVWITGEVVQGEFLVQDIFLGDRRLIRDELREVLTAYNLESIDDQYFGYH